MGLLGITGAYYQQRVSLAAQLQALHMKYA